MIRTVVAAALAALLASCAGAMTKPVQMTKAFNAPEAEFALRRGTSIVKGSALIRQNGGGVVTCAGMEVTLTPATEYATERMQILYKSIYEGFLPAGSANWINPASVPATTDPRYLQLTRKVTCDAQGNFEFYDVADGAFYLITNVTWSVGYNVQGGGLMKRVDVDGRNPVQQVVLTPH